jgi:hypothetical protein
VINLFSKSNHVIHYIKILTLLDSKALENQMLKKKIRSKEEEIKPKGMVDRDFGWDLDLAHPQSGTCHAAQKPILL